MAIMVAAARVNSTLNEHARLSLLGRPRSPTCCEHATSAAWTATNSPTSQREARLSSSKAQPSRPHHPRPRDVDCPMLYCKHRVLPVRISASAARPALEIVGSPNARTTSLPASFLLPTQSGRHRPRPSSTSAMLLLRRRADRQTLYSQTPPSR